jgi:hypothetical protein
MSIYSDVNQFSPNTTKPVLEDAETIYQSLFNLLSVRRGQRIFNPEYGTNLEGILHDLINEGTPVVIEREVNEAVLLFEPRVQLNDANTFIRQDVDNIHKFLTDFGFDITGILDQSFRFEGEITQ